MSNLNYFTKMINKNMILISTYFNNEEDLMIGNKLSKILSIFLALLFVIIPMGKCSKAASSFDKPVYAFGESLTKKQIRETAKLLGVEDSALSMRVNINELNSLLHDSYPYHQVYSSVYIKASDKGKGVSVKIATPSTITSITETQYANAAITAGAIDVDITVASVKAVDGSGALAGVYKAFQGTSGSLPAENIKVAQEELNVTSSINKENKGKENYSDDVLNAAVAEIKSKIDEKKEENNGKINNVQIGEIINNVVNNYNLNGVLSDKNIQSLNDLMGKFSKIKLTEEQKQSLKEFGQNLLDQGGKIMDSVKSSWDGLSPEKKREGLNLLQSVFNALANALSNLFSSIFK